MEEQEVIRHIVMERPDCVEFIIFAHRLRGSSIRQVAMNMKVSRVAAKTIWEQLVGMGVLSSTSTKSEFTELGERVWYAVHAYHKEDTIDPFIRVVTMDNVEEYFRMVVRRNDAVDGWKRLYNDIHAGRLDLNNTELMVKGWNAVRDYIVNRARMSDFKSGDAGLWVHQQAAKLGAKGAPPEAPEDRERWRDTQDWSFAEYYERIFDCDLLGAVNKMRDNYKIWTQKKYPDSSPAP